MVERAVPGELRKGSAACERSGVRCGIARGDPADHSDSRDADGARSPALERKAASAATGGLVRIDSDVAVALEEATAQSSEPGTLYHLLQELARAMQEHSSGRQVQVAREWAAGLLAPRFREISSPDEQQKRADEFLADEELDSGLW